MFHVIGWILRLLLIILAIVLGLVLLILLLVLFCPICYRASFKKDRDAGLKESEASARVFWLFGAISAVASYTGGGHSIELRLFGIPLDRILNKFKKKSSPSPAGEEPVQSGTVKESTAEPDAAETPDTGPAETGEELREPEKLPPAQEGSSEEPENGSDRTSAETVPGAPEKKPAGEKAEEDGSAEETPRKKGLIGLIQKILALPGKLYKKLQDIFKKVQASLRSIQWWKDFIFDPRTQEAIRLVLGELKKIIRHILPRAEGSLIFGSEDPSLTGRLTAVMGVTLPFHKNAIEFTPVFECEDILEADIRLKGRIFGIVFAAAAVKILIQKNVWFVIKHLKHKGGAQNG